MNLHSFIIIMFSLAELALTPEEIRCYGNSIRELVSTVLVRGSTLLDPERLRRYNRLLGQVCISSGDELNHSEMYVCIDAPIHHEVYAVDDDDIYDYTNNYWSVIWTMDSISLVSTFDWTRSPGIGRVTRRMAEPALVIQIKNLLKAVKDATKRFNSVMRSSAVTATNGFLSIEDLKRTRDFESDDEEDSA